MSEQPDAAMMYELGKSKGYDAAIKDVVAWLLPDDLSEYGAGIGVSREYREGLAQAIERGEAKGAANDLP